MFNDLQAPAPKRVRLESLDSSSSHKGTDSDLEDNECHTPLPRWASGDDILDSTENCDHIHGQLTSSQTELEISLPPVRADKEAIDEYEASRAVETNEQDANGPILQDRYDKRSWVKGKSSIYVDAFNLALEGVLNDEAHLFDEAEMAVFEHWKALNYESQYLYVRLFLRKTSSWHRINRLGYYHDIADLPAAVANLRLMRDLPISPTPTQSYLPGLELPKAIRLGETFRFAEGLGEISTLEEASSLLMLDELRTVAKEAKVEGKNKKELLKALQDVSGTQAGLEWLRSSKSGTEGCSYANPAARSHSTRQAVNRNSHFMRKILDCTGDCIRLSSAPLKLFERVHLVFYRSTEWTEKSLTTMILAKISRRNYPEYIVSRSNAIFPSRSVLLEFEASLRVQFEIDNAMEFSGPTTREKLQLVKRLSEGVYQRWKSLVDDEKRKEARVYDTGEGAYLRRFSPASVYTRIIHKGLYALARFKDYKREHELLTELLDQHLFHAARRGGWYQRKALLEEHYLRALVPSDCRDEQALKKEWKRTALRTCEEGLADPDCHLIYHYDLQKRITKLEKSLKMAKRDRHDFGHVMLIKPEERIVEGIRIEKQSPTTHGSKTSVGMPLQRGRATLWLDTRDGGECRVESMCLSWYRDNGWKGFHSEGGIVRTLFGYLLYDVLFTYVPNVFQTAYQTCPLDLHTDAFYPARASEINHRLAQIANGEAGQLIRQVHARESEKQTCAVGIDWSFELDDLVEIAQCFRGEALAAICKVMAQEYQQRGGGIPDLFLWSTERKEVMFSEVKSENDRLSDTQRLWIHVLTGAGVRVELCHAVAREVRVLT